LSSIIKSVVKRHDTLIGLDCSTKSLAFSKWDKGEFVTCGEINFEGTTVGTRLGSIHKALPPLIQSGLLKCDAVLIEAAVMVGQNPNTAIVLAYTYGAIMGAFNSEGIPVAKVRPLEWQSFIGNPNLKAHEKASLKKEFPGKSESWYKAEGRKVRKQKTLDWARQFAKIEDNSDNVGDAVGIGYYAVKNQHLLTFE
jgi:Holliday junction resolvasome RuvABC endonuclease subunit